MPDPIDSLQSLTDFVAEADRRSIDLSQLIRQTRDRIDRSHDLLAMYPADAVMGRHLVPYASIESAAARPD